MDWPHIHILINHSPVIGFWVALLWLIIAMAWRNPVFIRITLGFILLLAVITVPVFLTGGKAAGALAAIPMPAGSSDYVELHEHVALWSLIGGGILGLIALVGLVMKRQPGWLLPLLLVLCLGLNGLLMVTAGLGGMIAHAEIRHDPLSEAIVKLVPMSKEAGD